jgi:hypothetical protein
MAEWQEKCLGRIGNTAEHFDAPVGHFSRSPKGRGPFDLWRRRSSLMGVMPTSLLTPGQRFKMASVAATA